MSVEINEEQVSAIKGEYTADTLRELANQFALESLGTSLGALAGDARSSFVGQVADSMAGELREGGINEPTVEAIKAYVKESLIES